MSVVAKWWKLLLAAEAVSKAESIQFDDVDDCD